MSVHVQEIEVSGKKLLLHSHDDVCDPVTGTALTGSWLWGSALVLARWMAQLDQSTFSFEGKIVVELGAGTGFPGLVAALLGAQRVLLTDIAVLLPNLRLNVAANGLTECVEVKELVWGTKDLDQLGPADLVLMSDLFYDLDSMPHMVCTLKELCKEETIVWAATEMRLGTTDCFDVLIREGFAIHQEHETEDYAIFSIYPPCCKSE